jgi:uncharacterized protein YbaP (TraB family)
MVLDAFGSAAVLVVEADLMSSGEKERNALLKGKGRYPDKDSLEAYVKPATWLKVLEIGKKLGLSPDMLGSMKPWLAAVVLTEESLKQAGYTQELSIEQSFAKESQGKKPVMEMETVEDQIKAFEELSSLEQEQMLLQSLQALGRGPEVYKNQVDAWKHGDAEAMDMLARRSYDTGETSAKLYKVFYEDRNERMSNTLKDMAADGRTYFVVIGAENLVGDRGVLRLLESSGFKVTQP